MELESPLHCLAPRGKGQALPSPQPRDRVFPGCDLSGPSRSNIVTSLRNLYLRSSCPASTLSLYAVHLPWHLVQHLLTWGHDTRAWRELPRKDSIDICQWKNTRSQRNHGDTKLHGRYFPPAANRLREMVMVLLDQRQEMPPFRTSAHPGTCRPDFLHPRRQPTSTHLQTPRPDGQPMQSPSAP